MDVVFPFRTVLLLAKSRIGKPGIRKNAKKSKKIEIDDVQKALEDITQYVLEENATEKLKSPFGIAGLELDMSVRYVTHEFSSELLSTRGSE